MTDCYSQHPFQCWCPKPVGLEYSQTSLDCGGARSPSPEETTYRTLHNIPISLLYFMSKAPIDLLFTRAIIAFIVRLSSWLEWTWQFSWLFHPASQIKQELTRAKRGKWQINIREPTALINLEGNETGISQWTSKWLLFLLYTSTVTLPLLSGFPFLCYWKKKLDFYSTTCKAQATLPENHSKRKKPGRRPH